MAKAELVSIQYLRALAATLVVFHHSLDQLPAARALIPTQIGLIGVDLFFVISGFVMTYTAAVHSYSPGGFLARRAIRIVPLYWATTSLVALLLIFAPSFASNSAFTLDSYLKSLFFIPHVNPSTNAILPMLKLGWTLNFEAFFYVCFALVIMLGPILRTTLLTLGFTALIVAVALLQPEAAPLRFWADTIIYEFIFGCVVAIVFVKGGLNKFPSALWFALLLIGVAAIVVFSMEAQPAALRFLMFGIPCAAILAACVALESKAAAPWRNGLLHFLGDASYSIYLTHAYVVVAFRVIWQRLALPAEGWGPVLGFAAACIVTALIAGSVTYLVLEKPLTNGARRLFLRQREASA